MAPYLYISFGPHTIKVNRDHRHVSVWFALLFISSFFTNTNPLHITNMKRAYFMYCALTFLSGKALATSWPPWLMMMKKPESTSLYFATWTFEQHQLLKASSFDSCLERFANFFFAAVALIWWQIRYQYGTRRFHFTSSNNGTKWNLPLHGALFHIRWKILAFLIFSFIIDLSRKPISIRSWLLKLVSCSFWNL